MIAAMKSRVVLLLCAVLLALASSPCEARVWTRAADGVTMEGEFVRMKDASTAYIRREGLGVVEVPVALLIEEDQTFIKEQVAAAANPGGGSMALPEGETEVTLSQVHLCCAGCRRGVEGAVASFEGLELSMSGRTITVKGKTGAEVQKAIEAIAAAGFYGESDHKAVKIPEVNASGEEEGAASIKVAGVHLCCGACIDAVDAALAAIPGAKEHDASRNASTFAVTGEDIKPSAVLAALRAQGLNGTLE